MTDEPPTPEWVADHLRSLLRALDVAPPYVLVGHSWGGPLVRYFAGRYSDEVAGIVYVDPTDFTLTRRDDLALWESIGVGEAEYDAFRDAFKEETKELYEQMPSGLRAEYEVIEVFQSELRRQLPTMGDIPLAILIAAREEEPPPGIAFPFDYSQYFEAMIRQRVARFSELVLESPDATLVLATHSGHFIQNDDPDLVVEAIQRVAFRDQGAR
jgi:pimeloyl-ACP methyl ester carboxylesterase